MNKTYFSTAVAGACLLAFPAQAEESQDSSISNTVAADEPGQDDKSDGDIHGFFAIGSGAVPAFDGAKKYQLVPLMLADVEWQGLVLEVRGLSARLDLFGPSQFQLGPIVNFRGKRDSADDGKGKVKLLDDVDSAVEVGGFIGYRFGGNEYGQGEVAVDVSVAKDVSDGHEGVIGTAQISYVAYRSQKLFVNLDAQATFADDKYMNAYFGVSSEEAARSGLPSYEAEEGIRDVGAGVTVGYQFSRRWGLIARAGASHYLGDAKDSPIVDEGSKIQAIGGLAVSFRF
ncbi:MipA/OmpV family protein [Parasphingorhabdus litoris]|uniref:MipA/OmpV family protein n=1 Tax=Parasphingorhabdus litoris TaxID=394733 RepID=A0ABN1A114_9SPHN|nr:MipA/OmpV family protein [Parasphingorhabdus litoris]